MAEMAKNLYTRLYIYAKLGAIMYKYTVVTAPFRTIILGKIHLTRTIFGVIGGLRRHYKDGKSNNLLQNRGI